MMKPYDARWHELISTGGNPLGLTRAREHAVEAHVDQTYGNDKVPYVTHLDEVVAILEEFGIFNINTRVAGMLHDIVEDTSITLDDVRGYYGTEIADIVDRVTNPKNQPNRAARHAISYPRIRESDQAVRVKLADRLAHTRRKGSKHQMYVNEWPAFKEALYVPGCNHRTQAMWHSLESLTLAV